MEKKGEEYASPNHLSSQDDNMLQFFQLRQSFNETGLLIQINIEEAWARGQPRHGRHLTTEGIHKPGTHASANVSDRYSEACTKGQC